MYVLLPPPRICIVDRTTISHEAVTGNWDQKWPRLSEMRKMKVSYGGREIIFRTPAFSLTRQYSGSRIYSSANSPWEFLRNANCWSQLLSFWNKQTFCLGPIQRMCYYYSLCCDAWTFASWKVLGTKSLDQEYSDNKVCWGPYSDSNEAFVNTFFLSV